MIRTQVQLSEAQFELLKRSASDRGVSMAEVVRDLVDTHLGDSVAEDRWRRAVAALGRYRSGRNDIGVEHDRELGEAFLR